MKRIPLVLGLALMLCGAPGVRQANATTNLVFSETMAMTTAKPWTGTGCDNAWTVTYTGANPFEQATGWNYGSGNPCGMQFKQGTANLVESMITTAQGIAANGSAAHVEFYLWADGLSGTAGWTFQLDSGAGYVTRLSELTGANHGYQLYHYDLQPTELVNNLRLRFQFAGGAAPCRINLDQISLYVVTATNLPFSVVLNSPANGASYGSPASVPLVASAYPGNGATITGVGFFELASGPLGSVLTFPYSTSTVLNTGTYNIYAVATNSLNAVTFSSTNTVSVTNAALAVALTAPANGQSYAESLTLTAAATVSGGDAPYTYSVVFHLESAGGVWQYDGAGPSPVFTAALGALPEGTYRVYADASDGFTSVRSATNTFTTLGSIKVPVTGVTMTFDAAPPMAQWSTYSVPGTPAAQSYAEMDNTMATIAAATIATALGTQVASGTSSNAYWRSSDQKLGTQPTGNRATLLMATLVNDAGVEVLQLDVAYTLGLASVTPSEANKGHRVYWSRTGLASNWTAIGFYSLAAPGTITNRLLLTGLQWSPGQRLYLVWLDENGNANPDGDYTIDDISFVPTVGTLNVSVTAPGNGQTFGAPAVVTLAASASPGAGASITGVGFFEVTSGLLGSALAFPYSASTILNAGTYNIYAVATNSLNAIAFSATNTIAVTNVPLSVVLTSPANGASYGSPANVILTASAYPGVGATVSSVTFYMVSNGNSVLLFTDTASPYSNQLSGLTPGSYGFYAVVTNSLSATAVSVTNTITVSSGTVMRGPYLGRRGETNITIRWRTAETSVGRVRFGPAPGNFTSFADDTTSRTDHIVLLTGLAPETQYYYSIGTPSGTTLASTNYYFSTAPPIGTSRSTRIWFMSDYGQADAIQSAVRDTYLNYLATSGRGTDLWLTGGDNEQGGTDGTDAGFQTAVFNAYSNIFPNTSFFPCPGNHDGGPSSAYWSIFDLPTQGQAGGYPSGNAHYYSFNYGNVHFISLDAFNTATDVGSPMWTWLNNDLAATTQTWTIAYWHAPVYCTAGYDSDALAQSLAMRQNFAPLLEAYGVDLVLNGHSHSLQRTYLLQQHYGLSSSFSPTNKVDGGDGRTDGTGAYLKPGRTGTVYCVAPTGCGTLRNGTNTHPACLYTLNNTAGFILLDVNSNRLDFKMMTSSGMVGDYFTILKGASQSTPPATPASLAASTSGSSANLSWSNNATNEASYRLERSINGADFAEIAAVGANLTTFTNAGLNFDNAYYYRLRSWNNAGYSEYTPIASLTPSGALAIDGQPQSVTAAAGTSALLYVLARGTPPILYQWYFEGTLLSGQTNSTLKLTSVSAIHTGHYTVVLSNGGTPLTSDAAMLTVTPFVSPPTLVSPPTVSNGIFAVAFQAAGGVIYTVQSEDALNNTWQNRSNVTAPANGIIVIQEAVSGVPSRFYRLVHPPQ